MADHTVSFSDSFGGAIVLHRGALGLAHQGSIAVRSPAVRLGELCARCGLTEPQARAIEFVASWFGAPLDAASLQSDGEYRLSWGCWHLRGPRLTSCLAGWKAQAGRSFESLLQPYGIDVSAPGPEDPSSTSAVLVATDLHSGASVRGRTAETAISRTPVLLAALARAGRHRDAQAAQIAAIARDGVAPLLSTRVPLAAETTTLADVVQSARGWSVMLYLELRFGARRAAHILADAARGWRDTACSERALVQLVPSCLQQAGLHGSALQVERILTSPEFDCT